MEFKFRAVDDRPPPPHSPVVHPLPSPVPVPPFANAPVVGHELTLRSPMPNPYDAQALERERIRDEEILLDEIARRREIELEARREIVLLEREIAARRARLSLDHGLAPIQWGSYSRLVPRHSFLDEWCGLTPRPAVALPPRDGGAGEVGTPSLDHNKDKVIILAKPNPNVSGTKRKSVEPPPTLAPPFGLKKKPKDEWSCALCRVSASSEVVLNEHLQGKKHKANEERLKKQKLASSDKSEPAQKKSRRNGSNSMIRVKLEGESFDENNAETISTDVKPELVPVKSESAGDLNNAAGSTMARQENGTKEQKKNKFTFWCEMCRVGSNAALVMEDHKNGKKHRVNLLKLDKSNEATKPIHISAEATVPKLVMGSETSGISLENNVPMPEIPNLICERDGVPMSSKAVIVPKLEERDVAYKSDKIEEFALGNNDFSSKAVVPNHETVDIDAQATEENIEAQATEHNIEA